MKMFELLSTNASVSALQIAPAGRFVPDTSDRENEVFHSFISRSPYGEGDLADSPYYQNFISRYWRSMHDYADYVSRDGFTVEVESESRTRAAVFVFGPDGESAHCDFESTIQSGHFSGQQDYKAIIDRTLAAVKADWAAGNEKSQEAENARYKAFMEIHDVFLHEQDLAAPLLPLKVSMSWDDSWRNIYLYDGVTRLRAPLKLTGTDAEKTEQILAAIAELSRAATAPWTAPTKECIITEYTRHGDFNKLRTAYLDEMTPTAFSEFMKTSPYYSALHPAQKLETYLEIIGTGKTWFGMAFFELW